MMYMIQIDGKGEIRYKGYCKREGFRVLRRDEEDDQVDIFNVIQKRPDNGIHLKVE